MRPAPVFPPERAYAINPTSARQKVTAMSPIFPDQPNELVLTESRTLRDVHAFRVDVLDKVKALALLPDDTHATTEIVASYFEVGVDAIESIVRRYRDELEENGMRTLRSDRLHAFETANLTVSNGGQNRRALRTFTRRTILNVGQLLTESDVARKVRTYLLSVEEMAGAEARSMAAPTAIGSGTVTWDHAAAVARLQYGFKVDAHGFRELLTTGGILTTKNGIPHRNWEHLFWPSPSGTRWEIHVSVLPQLIGFAREVRTQLARAERHLQMSLPFPIASQVRAALEDGDAA